MKNINNIFLKIVILVLATTYNSYAANDIFTCKTEKHTIVISKIDANTYQYKSWNKPKLINEKPDMELKSSDFESHGGCSNFYKFKIGKTEFTVSNQWSCSDDEGRKEELIGATGDLWVRVNGKVRSHYYCYK